MSDIITTPDTTSPELFRYFNRRHCRLVSVRADGAIYTRIIGEDWEPNRAAAANAAELDARIAKTRLYLDQAPVWTRKITDLPDPDMIERWIMDGVVEATDGTDVDPPGPFQRRLAPPEPLVPPPDGTSPDGAPSWLLALRLI